MRIVVPPLDVKEDDAFTNDLFERKAFGEALRNVVERSSDELVISLDGQWGEGKTTFVKMWRGLLNESNIPSIYINAFENDYVDDAFISVASAITSFADNNISDKDKISEFIEKSKAVGGKLLAWSARLGIKAASLGIVKDSDIEGLKDIKGDLSKTVSGVIGDFIEERLESHSKDIESVKSFRNALSELPIALNNGDSEVKPLVIVIDELDRCRPTYAVDLIEKIKHLFSVKNVVFVLVIHMQQLEESIKCIYGQNIDAHTYLQKFINIETTLPKRIGDRHLNDLDKYASKLLELHELETWGDNSLIIDCVEPLANHYNLSLRQLEKVFVNIAVLYSSSSKQQLRLVPLIVFISIIKVINKPLFQRLLLRTVAYDDVRSEMNLPDIIESDNNKLNWMMKWIKYALLTEEELSVVDDKDELIQLGGSLARYNIGREQLIPVFIQQLSMFSVK